MKVLILTNSILGLYNFRREIIQQLIQDEYEVVISAPEGQGISYFSEIGCDCIVTDISKRGTNPITDLKLISNYFRMIKSIEPDIVLTYTIKPNVYGGIVCRILGIPYIANITGLGTAIENKGVLKLITLFLYRLSLKKAQTVFFQNNENRRLLQQHNIALNNDKLIPGSGVNLGHFNLIEYPSDNYYIKFLFIGRVMKEKGIDQYLEAAKFIKNKYPYTQFHILGDCEEAYIKTLRELENQGIVIYYGRQNDVRTFHKISHCTIHPTYYPEGMSNVLLESAASGRPIITTNRSGCREIVDHGVNGYVVEQENSQDLIDKIEMFLSLTYEEKKRMGQAGRDKVEGEFDRQIVVDSYMQEINKNFLMEKIKCN